MALFCCISDADTSLNYLVGMIYSQLFQMLYRVADRMHGGRLPMPVHCIMVLAIMRSRSISCSIIIQNMAQLKALFKDAHESQRKGYDILAGEEFSCLEFHMDRDTISWILNN